MTLMSKLVLVILMSASQAASAESVSESLEQVEIGRELGGIAIQLLNDVSIDWSYASLQKYTGKYLEPNRIKIEGMLHSSSILGRFKACKDSKIGAPKDLEIPGAKALIGNCDFENGIGNVSIIFINVEGNFRAVALIIKPHQSR